MEEVIDGILIREVETKNIMTKSSLPVGGYSVNPYVIPGFVPYLPECLQKYWNKHHSYQPHGLLTSPYIVPNPDGYTWKQVF